MVLFQNINFVTSMKGESFDTLLKVIGYRLTELRKRKGYSSHENFAWDHDLPRAQYWRLEKGKANFTIKTLIKVLAIHNLTIEEFFRVHNKISEALEE